MKPFALLFALLPTCLPALTWEAAMKEAAGANLDLRSAAADVEAARASKGQSRSAFLPRLDASGRAGRSGSQAVSGGESALPPGDSDKESSSYSLGLDASWRLFNGFADWKSLEESGYTLLQRQGALDSARAEARRSLRTAFLHLLYAQGVLAVNQDILERRAQSSLYQKLKFESGRQARWTWKKALADEADARWRSDQAAGDLEVAQAELALALGRPSSEGLSAEGTLAPAEPPALDLGRLKLHPSARRLRYQRLAAEARLAREKAAYLPTLSANAGWSYSGRDQWPPENRAWSAGLSAGFNLFNGGFTAYGVGAAEASLASLKASEEETRRSLETAARRAWARALSSARQVTVADAQLEAARERYETVSKLYQAGRAGFLDLEQAESGLTGYQQQGLALRQSAGQARADLESALGMGLGDTEEAR